MAKSYKIYHGGKTIELIRSEHVFNIINPTQNILNSFRKDSNVIGLNYQGLAIWRISLQSSFVMPDILGKIPAEIKAHPAYIRKIGNHFAYFTPTKLLFIRFKSKNSNLVKNIESKYNVNFIENISDDIIRFEISNSAKLDSIELCELLNNDSDIDFCEPDYLLELNRFDDPQPTENFFEEQWHLFNDTAMDGIDSLKGIKADKAWNITKGIEDVVVAVFDDGYDLTNPDLQNGIVYPSNFANIDAILQNGGVFGPSDNQPLASKEIGDYHGTPCAGLVIGRKNSQISGVAPGCSWMPVRTQFGVVSLDNTIRIFQYISKYADVVSCSWGAQPSGFENPSTTLLETMRELIENGGRRKKGLVICFASGNENLPTYIASEDNVNGMEYYNYEGKRLGTFFKGEAIYSCWCQIPGVVVVGAVTYQGRKSLYSNWGPNITIVAPSNNYTPDRRKFGSSALVTTNNEKYGRSLKDVGLSDVELGYVTKSMGGTSGATPQVAGVCSLILSINPNLNSAEVIDVLIQSADKSNLDFTLDTNDLINNKNQDGRFSADNGHSIWFGYGHLDANSAVIEAKKRLDTKQ